MKSIVIYNMIPLCVIIHSNNNKINDYYYPALPSCTVQSPHIHTLECMDLSQRQTSKLYVTRDARHLS